MQMRFIFTHGQYSIHPRRNENRATKTGAFVTSRVTIRTKSYFQWARIMTERGSVSRWISGLKAGDELAAQKIWERYYRLLVTHARKKLRTSARREADEEDITQNAFHSFFRGVDRGRFPQLDDRDDLWRASRRDHGPKSVRPAQA